MVCNTLPADLQVSSLNATMNPIHSAVSQTQDMQGSPPSSNVDVLFSSLGVTMQDFSSPSAALNYVSGEYLRLFFQFNKNEQRLDEVETRNKELVEIVKKFTDTTYPRQTSYREGLTKKVYSPRETNNSQINLKTDNPKIKKKDGITLVKAMEMCTCGSCYRHVIHKQGRGWRKAKNQNILRSRDEADKPITFEIPEECRLYNLKKKISGRITCSNNDATSTTEVTITTEDSSETYKESEDEDGTDYRVAVPRFTRQETVHPKIEPLSWPNKIQEYEHLVSFGRDVSKFAGDPDIEGHLLRRKLEKQRLEASKKLEADEKLLESTDSDDSMDANQSNGEQNGNCINSN